jgi:hypothetical protein
MTPALALGIAAMTGSIGVAIASGIVSIKKHSHN